jgi:hypothetical protein
MLMYQQSYELLLTVSSRVDLAHKNLFHGGEETFYRTEFPNAGVFLKRRRNNPKEKGKNSGKNLFLPTEPSLSKILVSNI